jgi:hypothetical protein
VYTAGRQHRTLLRCERRCTQAPGAHMALRNTELPERLQMVVPRGCGGGRAAERAGRGTVRQPPGARSPRVRVRQAGEAAPSRAQQGSTCHCTGVARGVLDGHPVVEAELLAQAALTRPRRKQGLACGLRGCGWEGTWGCAHRLHATRLSYGGGRGRSTQVFLTARHRGLLGGAPGADHAVPTHRVFRDRRHRRVSPP